VVTKLNDCSEPRDNSISAADPMQAVAYSRMLSAVRPPEGRSNGCPIAVTIPLLGSTLFSRSFPTSQTISVPLAVRAMAQGSLKQASFAEPIYKPLLTAGDRGYKAIGRYLAN
jgi:hypothetical protein